VTLAGSWATDGGRDDDVPGASVRSPAPQIALCAGAMGSTIPQGAMRCCSALFAPTSHRRQSVDQLKRRVNERVAFASMLQILCASRFFSVRGTRETPSTADAAKVNGNRPRCCMARPDRHLRTLSPLLLVDRYCLSPLASHRSTADAASSAGKLVDKLTVLQKNGRIAGVKQPCHHRERRHDQKLKVRAAHFAR